MHVFPSRSYIRTSAEPVSTGTQAYHLHTFARLHDTTRAVQLRTVLRWNMQDIRDRAMASNMKKIVVRLNILRNPSDMNTRKC